MITIELIWIQLMIYEKYNGIILVNFGVVASFFVCKIIICSVTKVKNSANVDAVSVFQP